MFLDPSFAGMIFSETNDGMNVTLVSSGMKNVHGFFVEAAWFPNPNVGLALNVTHLVSEVEVWSGGDARGSSAELALIGLSAISRMVGHNYPSTVGVGFGGGVAYVDLREEGDVSGSGYYRRGEALLPLLTVSVETTVPLLKFAHLTGGLEYAFVPFDDFTLRDPDGPYSRTYREGNLGGLALQLGVVVEL